MEPLNKETTLVIRVDRNLTQLAIAELVEWSNELTEGVQSSEKIIQRLIKSDQREMTIQLKTDVTNHKDVVEKHLTTILNSDWDVFNASDQSVTILSVHYNSKLIYDEATIGVKASDVTIKLNKGKTTVQDVAEMLATRTLCMVILSQSIDMHGYYFDSEFQILCRKDGESYLHDQVSNRDDVIFETADNQVTITAVENGNPFEIIVYNWKQSQIENFLDMHPDIEKA
jgi:hypothetical protein